MLNSLEIENIAVIEHAEIGFDGGLNILTGETGAGKSIVIDAINAILGERTSKDIIRSGCDKAKVTAVFDRTPAELVSVFEQYDIETDESGILITRIISSDGRGSCKVNGSTVTVSVLREIGRNLITICGQHDSQFLLDKEHHLDFIDSMADSDEILDEYKNAFYNLVACKKKLRKLQKLQEDKDIRVDILKYQIDEIRNAEIKIGEKADLLRKKKEFQNHERISGNLSAAHQLMLGDDSADGILSELHMLNRYISEISDVNTKFSDISSELENIIYSLSDYSSEISSYLVDLSDGADNIDHIENRLDTIYRLSKKYGSTEEEILSYLDKITDEYNCIFNNEEETERLQEELYELEEDLFKKGCHLSDIRKSAAIDFENRVKRELSYLDMPDAQFVVNFNDATATSRGFDDVEFLFSANAGQEVKPLQKIASGGELSRVMLAVRCVLNDSDSLDTMIFDEIDTGVSGRAAHKIAYKMHELSMYKQVICVTHLAQIAAYADNHLYIEKHQSDGFTSTSVRSLSDDERISEIARIIGGDVITATTLKSAKELIDFAGNEGF